MKIIYTGHPPVDSTANLPQALLKWYPRYFHRDEGCPQNFMLKYFSQEWKKVSKILYFKKELLFFFYVFFLLVLFENSGPHLLAEPNFRGAIITLMKHVFRVEEKRQGEEEKTWVWYWQGLSHGGTIKLREIARKPRNFNNTVTVKGSRWQVLIIIENKSTLLFPGICLLGILQSSTPLL